MTYRRRWYAVTAATALLISINGAGAWGTETPEDSSASVEIANTDLLSEGQRVVPGSEYSLLGVSSESDPYPEPGYVDGTAEAVFTDDMNDTWAVRYNTVEGVGVAVDDFPHWIAFDTGAQRQLVGFQYAIKNLTSGPATDYAIYVSDAAEAPDPNGDWGAAVATGTLPITTPDIHTVEFSEPVQGRWVRFEILGSAHSGNVSGASLIRVIENYEDAPTDPPTDPTNPATPVALNLNDFTVQVAEEFPQIIDYSIGAATMKGNADKLSAFSINGATVQAETSFQQDSATKVSYTSTFPGTNWDGLTVKSSFIIEDEGVVRFLIESIEGNKEGQVQSIGIPGQQLLQIDSSQPTATLSRTKIDTDSSKSADSHLQIKADTAVDVKAVTSPYAFVSNAEIAAGVYSNSTLVTNSTNTDDRLLTQITKDDSGATVATVSSNTWVWTPMQDGENGVSDIDERVERFENPQVVVALAVDKNESGSVDWQDAAIILRDQIESPEGSERVAERVAQRIPFNFGSEASNPFLKTLDNVKRVSLATDGLGQWVLLKGYGSEGHDSANTDYGGHYNERAGGLEDLNALVSEGHENWNTDFAVHVNTTEAYPQARAFSDLLTSNTTASSGKGWGWLNQSYYINQFYDLGSGGVIDRFQQLRDETEIDTVYIDVYYSSGWRAEGLADQLHQMGFEVATEWAHKFEGNSIWSHWSNDKSYGGSSDKGINSDMIRFMFNTERDVWNIDSLLGGVNMLDFEGWGAKDNYNTYIDSIWTDNLPAKYLQHFEINSWKSGVSASLEGNVEITTQDGVRVITQNGVEVLRGKASNITYLLPWGAEDENSVSSPLEAEKMYYYSTDGGTHEFGLTDSLAGYATFEQHRLTDNGREKVANITQSGGKITLTGEAGVAYVVVPTGDPDPYSDVEFGQYTLVDDPGFNAGNLDVWNVDGEAEIVTLNNGDKVVEMGQGQTTLSQEITGLTPGQKYSLSAMVEIGPNAQREFTMSAGDETNSFSITPVQNKVGSESKHNTYMQRAFVTFTAPESGTQTISFQGENGDAAIRIDDVRIQQVEILTNKEPLQNETAITSLVGDFSEDALYWDFEDNQPGWGPFVRGGAGGLSDARTSISELHESYSQSTWKNTNWPYNGSSDATLTNRGIDDVLSGTHSLKSYDEYTGLLYRTIPARVTFETGHRYAVSFSYQATKSNEYQVVFGVDDVASGGTRTTSTAGLKATDGTQRWETEITAGCDGSTYFGIVRTAGEGSLAELVIDDVLIEDLGVSEEAATCAVVDADAPEAFNKGAANRVVTNFTNNETVTVTNVSMLLEDLPEGWSLETESENGNLFESVLPGETVSTTWLVHVPAETTAAGATLGIVAQYAINCEDRSIASESDVTVSQETRMAIPASAITGTTSMTNQGGEGIENALQDSDTLWHSSWSGSVQLPAWVEFTLDEATTLDGWGYQQRPSGVNGRLKDYRIEVMQDGEWVQVASGTWQAATTLQVVDFDEVQTDKIRMMIDSVYSGDSSGNTYTSARRLILYGVPTTQENGYAPGVRPATDTQSCEKAPESVLSIDGQTADSGWYLTQPSISLAITNGGENSEIWYRLSSSDEFAKYGSPVTVPDGTWQVEHYAVGDDGTTETIQQSAPIKVDTDAPEVAATFNDKYRSVIIEANDEVSGLHSIEYSLGDGEWVVYVGNISVGNEEGSLRFRATDIAGNTSAEQTLKYEAAPGAEIPPRPQVSLGKTEVRAGDSIEVKVINLGKVNATTVEVGIASTYQKLADLEIDSSGTAIGTVVIPRDIAVGLHTIHVKDAQGLSIATATLKIVGDDGSSSGPSGSDSGGSSSAGSTSNSSGLAKTGALTLLVLLLAGVAGGTGFFLLQAKRREI